MSAHSGMKEVWELGAYAHAVTLQNAIRAGRADVLQASTGKGVPCVGKSAITSSAKVRVHRARTASQDTSAKTANLEEFPKDPIPGVLLDFHIRHPTSFHGGLLVSSKGCLVYSPASQPVLRAHRIACRRLKRTGTLAMVLQVSYLGVASAAFSNATSCMAPVGHFCPHGAGSCSGGCEHTACTMEDSTQSRPLDPGEMADSGMEMKKPNSLQRPWGDWWECVRALADTLTRYTQWRTRQ
jgi:hypothetical protein